MPESLGSHARVFSSYQSMHPLLLIAQAVGAVSNFNSCPTEAHLTAVKQIFHYLKGTINLGIKYERSVSDVDWAGDMDNRQEIIFDVLSPH